jgi:octaprenyl-diphosphate synthase
LLKAVNAAEMTLQLDSALSTLVHAARRRTKDLHTAGRLAEVQAYLAADLRGVEDRLTVATQTGPEPATDAAEHLVGRGGKRVRPISLLLAARCFGGSGERYVEMAATVELVHSATLLHDDVIDEGMERRGAPTARRILGNAVSVLAGDLLLVGALERTQRVAPELLADLIATLGRLVDGEIVQLRGRTELDFSEESYARVLRDKTAALFSFASAAGARMAGATPEQQAALGRFGEELGLAFQLVDDVLDYDGVESGKSLLADLMEGKLTLPLVLATRADAGLAELVRSIHAGDVTQVGEVSRRVVASGACEVTRARAIAHTEQALASLAVLPDSRARSLLEVVARELGRRVS